MANELSWIESASGTLESREERFAVDTKGRSVGGYAVIYSRRAGYHTGKPAFFALALRATRAGSRFGAIAHETPFATLEEAKAAAPAKLAAQKARYLKKFVSVTEYENGVREVGQR